MCAWFWRYLQTLRQRPLRFLSCSLALHSTFQRWFSLRKRKAFCMSSILLLLLLLLMLLLTLLLLLLLLLLSLLLLFLLLLLLLCQELRLTARKTTEDRASIASYSVRIGFAHRIVAHSLWTSVPQCVQLPALVSEHRLRGLSSSLHAQLSLRTLDLPHTVGVNLACELPQSRRKDFMERCDQRLPMFILHALVPQGLGSLDVAHEACPRSGLHTTRAALVLAQDRHGFGIRPLVSCHAHLLVFPKSLERNRYALRWC